MDVCSKGRYNIEKAPSSFPWSLWLSITEELCDSGQEQRRQEVGNQSRGFNILLSFAFPGPREQKDDKALEPVMRGPQREEEITR